MKYNIVLVFFIFMLNSSFSGAAIITPVSGSSSQYDLFGSVNNVIDGSLDHNSYLGIGDQVFGRFSGPYNIRFDLGGSFDLTQMNLWNNAGSIQNDGEGINGFELRFFDNGLAYLNSISSSARDILAQQIYNFDVSNVVFVDLVIHSNHAFTSRGYANFYEINFVGTGSNEIPEPGSWLLWLTSILTFLGWIKTQARHHQWVLV